MTKILYISIACLVGVSIFLTSQAISIGVSSNKGQKQWHNSDITGTFMIGSFMTFSWVPTEWTDCSEECGPGTQIRTSYCRGHNNTHYYGACHSLTKPAEGQSCNLKSCKKTSKGGKGGGLVPKDDSWKMHVGDDYESYDSYDKNWNLKDNKKSNKGGGGKDNDKNQGNPNDDGV